MNDELVAALSDARLEEETSRTYERLMALYAERRRRRPVPVSRAESIALTRARNLEIRRLRTEEALSAEEVGARFRLRAARIKAIIRELDHQEYLDGLYTANDEHAPA